MIVNALELPASPFEARTSAPRSGALDTALLEEALSRTQSTDFADALQSAELTSGVKSALPDDLSDLEAGAAIPTAAPTPQAPTGNPVPLSGENLQAASSAGDPKPAVRGGSSFADSSRFAAFDGQSALSGKASAREAALTPASISAGKPASSPSVPDSASGAQPSQPVGNNQPADHAPTLERASDAAPEPKELHRQGAIPSEIAAHAPLVNGLRSSGQRAGAKPLLEAEMQQNQAKAVLANLPASQTKAERRQELAIQVAIEPARLDGGTGSNAAETELRRQQQAALPPSATHQASQQSATAQALLQTANTAANTTSNFGANAATQPASVLGEPRLTGDLEGTISQLNEARETGRNLRPELALKHAEFGLVNMRLEASGGDLRATLTNRDPAFVPAVQAALPDRAIAGVADTSTSHSQRGNDGGSGQPGGSSGTGASANHGSQAGSHGGAGQHSGPGYAFSPREEQATSQPYSEHQAAEGRNAAAQDLERGGSGLFA